MTNINPDLAKARERNRQTADAFRAERQKHLQDHATENLFVPTAVGREASRVALAHITETHQIVVQGSDQHAEHIDVHAA